MQKISKVYYLGSIIGSFAVSKLVVLYCIGMRAFDLRLALHPSRNPITANQMAVYWLTYPILIYGIVMLMILVFKMWGAIRGGVARTTPGQAIGFLSRSLTSTGYSRRTGAGPRTITPPLPGTA